MVERLTVGFRVPDPYFKRATDKTIAVGVTRTCQDCGYSFVTSEVPYVWDWAGTIAWCCPRCYDLGLLLWVSNVRATRKERKMTRTTLLAISMGAVRRRYQCPGTHWNEQSQLYEGCLQWNNKPSRWSTIEIMGDGTVVPDITTCPQCGGYCPRVTLRSRITRFKFAQQALNIAQAQGRLLPDALKEIQQERARRRQIRRLVHTSQIQPNLFEEPGFTSYHPMRKSSGSRPRSVRPIEPGGLWTPTTPRTDDDPPTSPDT